MPIPVSTHRNFSYHTISTKNLKDKEHNHIGYIGDVTGGALPEGQSVVGRGVGHEVAAVGAEGARRHRARVRRQRLAAAGAQLVDGQLARVAAHCGRGSGG